MTTRSSDGMEWGSSAARRRADRFWNDLMGFSEQRRWPAGACDATEQTGTPVSLSMRSGGVVGNTAGSTNRREDVLHALERLHVLWSIQTPHYDAEYRTIAALPAGQRVVEADRSLPRTLAALGRNLEPSLHARVIRELFSLDASANVGTGQPNQVADVRSVQTVLATLGILLPSASSEGGAAGGTIAEAAMPQTLAAIRVLKERYAGARLGWSPIHATEFASGGDRFGSRTFELDTLSVFVPRNVRTGVNNVHVFFSPGGSRGESGLNAVLHHGLRAACEQTDWILIGVPGADPGFVTIDTAQIEAALRRCGRSGSVDRLRLSAHSRGYRGLRETLARSLVDTSRIDRIVVLDAGYDSLAAAIRTARVPGSRVVAYGVNTPDLALSGARNVRIPGNCARAIGYSRLIQAAGVTRPSLPIPAAIRTQLLTLPARGSFNLAGSAAGGTDLTDFCRSQSAQIQRIIRGEDDPTSGLRVFLDTHDLGRFGMAFTPGVYSHHFFVAEIAHEITS